MLQPLYRVADRIRYRVHRDSGRHGEDLAHRWLIKHGFIVAARNWRPPQGGGEIDIVAWKAETLVFVEVKYRASGQWSAPERQIDRTKIDALRRAARDYIRRAGAEESPSRFDLICITGTAIEHVADAFAVAPARAD
jgi:putative endonuclease